MANNNNYGANDGVNNGANDGASTAVMVIFMAIIVAAVVYFLMNGTLSNNGDADIPSQINVDLVPRDDGNSDVATPPA